MLSAWIRIEISVPFRSFRYFFFFTNRYLLFLFTSYAVNMYFPLLKYKTRLGYSSVVEHVSSMRRAWSNTQHRKEPSKQKLNSCSLTLMNAIFAYILRSKYKIVIWKVMFNVVPCVTLKNLIALSSWKKCFSFLFFNTTSIIIIFILKWGLIWFSVAVLDLFRLAGVYVLDT